MTRGAARALGALGGACRKRNILSLQGQFQAAAKHWHPRQPVAPPACGLRELTGAQSIAVIFVPDSECIVLVQPPQR